MLFCGMRTKVPFGVWIRDARSSLKAPAELISRAREDVAKSLIMLDKHLPKNPYVVGDRVGLCPEADGTWFG